jgi:hypothetical protein
MAPLAGDEKLAAIAKNVGGGVVVPSHTCGKGSEEQTWVQHVERQAQGLAFWVSVR